MIFYDPHCVIYLIKYIISNIWGNALKTCEVDISYVYGDLSLNFTLKAQTKTCAVNPMEFLFPFGEVKL